MERVRRLKPGLLLAGAGLVGTGLWLARMPLAAEAVDVYLARHGIEGRYAIEALSPSAAVLTGVRLGPAAAPDLVADRIELELGGWTFAPEVVAVRLTRPRLRMTVTPDRLSFGTLDALLPEPTDEPTTLPAMRVDIRGGRLLAATPLGPLAFAIESSGRLSDGFDARATLEPRDLRRGACRIGEVTGSARIRTAAGDRVTIAARGGAAGAGCGTFDARRPAWTAQVATDAGLAQARGNVTLAADRLRTPTGSIAAPAARVGFGGTLAAIGGTWQASAGAMRGAGATLRSAGGEGTFAGRPASGELTARGELRLRGVATDLPTRAFAASHPLAGALAARVGAAARRFDATTPVNLHLAGGRYALFVPRLEAVSATGARLSLAGGRGLRLGDDGGTVDGTLRLGGGGLPTATARFDTFGLGARGAGQVRIEIGAWRADGAVLAVPALVVRRSAEGVSAQGRVRYDGPVGDARVRNLDIALGVDAAPDLAEVRLGGSCAAVGFAGLTSGDLSLEAARTRLCPVGRLAWANGALAGGLAIDRLSLRGRSGDAPLRLQLDAARLSIASDRVRLQPVEISGSLGTQRLQATFAGEADLGGSAARGRISRLALSGGDLPVSIGAGTATLSLARGSWRLAGVEARVSDALPEARFQPLRIADATAVIERGVVRATGAARLAASGERLFGFTLRHDLGAGSGAADLATGPLIFSDRLQPYEITEALRGVVENVAGRVEGTGRVRWTADGFESEGQVAIRDVSLATAALGPVTGINGTVRIDDLFALTTPPGQQVTVASMNPGVLVEDGRFAFRMLGPTSAHIEDARWPFAGGTLTMRPVTISAGELRREFTLDVAGLDAGLFLQRFELEDVNATGTFDGTLPLIFDGSAGRVVGGTLIARPGGGLIQYVGDVGADSMGAAGRLAFDALKRMRYRSLSLSLDGDLDGELVTAVRFTGTNEAPVRPAGGVPIRAAGLPFKFNVTVRAPFRRLLGTAASFSDAREVIRSGAAGPEETPATPPVQPR